MLQRINQEIENELPSLRNKFILLKIVNKEIHDLAINYDNLAKEIDDLEEYISNSIYARKLKKTLKKLKRELITKLKSKY